MSKRKDVVKMRFVGKPDGVLMKHAPGNYEHGKIYPQPFKMSQYKFWELIDRPPEIIAPPLTEEDDVFGESMFVPEETTVSAPGEIKLDPNTPASVEPYMSFNTGTGQLSDINPEDFTQTPEPTPKEAVPEPTRDELLTLLEKAGVDVKPRTRTTTLLKMVAELGLKEDA